MKYRPINLIGGLLVLGGSFMGCSDILDAKPQQSLLVPSKLSDFQALLDDLGVMNHFTPGLPSMASDDFYTNESGWEKLQPIERNTYLWGDDIYENHSEIGDWSLPYKAIFNANIVLDGLEQLEKEKDTEQVIEIGQVRGRALFYRCFAYYTLVQMFCAAYDSQQAENLLGVPLQLTSDVNVSARRASLNEVYDQIKSDLLIAMEFLDNSSIRSRPSNVACFALLARICLLTGDYDDARSWASEALEIQGELLDYNTLSSNDDRPFPRSYLHENREVIFYAAMMGYSFNSSTLTFVVPELYNLYDDNDLRKLLFFKTGDGGMNLKGTYTGTSVRFTGISNSELLLIRAECSARTDKFISAREDMSTLLSNRYSSGTFSGLDVADVDLLDFILVERRKELVGRDIRWTDLKRFNLESEFATTITRQLDNQEYSLLPNDERYIFPFPKSETISW